MNALSFLEKIDLFSNIDPHVNVQIQHKRRKTNADDGMFNAPLELLQGLGGFNFGISGQGQGGNGWGQEGGWGQGGQGGGWGNNNNGWQSDNGWGNNQGGNQGGGLDIFGHFGMALLANEKLWGNDLDGMDWVFGQMKRQAYQIVPATQAKDAFKVGDMGDCQMTYLEPSPAAKKLEELKRLGKPF